MSPQLGNRWGSGVSPLCRMVWPQHRQMGSLLSASSALPIGVILALDSGTLVGMFEHFTDGARRTLVLAQVEARNLHDSSIGPEHLLLGMLREGEGIAAAALADAGTDYYQARGVLEAHERQQPGQGSGPQPFSNATMRVMERSLQISWAQADGGIDTEHLLVALLEEGDEATEVVLAGLDITPEEVVQRVDALLAERTLRFGDRRAAARSPLRD
jgi:ATP-dependent Clp protease ATP-binding subunit ClpA